MLMPGPLLHVVPWERCLLCLVTTALQDLHHCLQPSPRDHRPSHPHPANTGTGHILELTLVFALRQNPGGEPRNHNAVQDDCEGEGLHR